MNVTTNNKKRNNIKLVMDRLMDCIKDKSISKEDRNLYYSEYLKLSKDYLILSR